MIKSGAKARFVLVETHYKAFNVLKHHLYMACDMIMLYLQQHFKIEIDTSDYAANVEFTHHRYPLAYQKQMFSHIIHIYPTYDMELDSII